MRSEFPAPFKVLTYPAGRKVKFCSYKQTAMINLRREESTFHPLLRQKVY
jgi:hypothetical protein